MRAYTLFNGLNGTVTCLFRYALGLIFLASLPAFSQTVTGMGSAYNGDGTFVVCQGEMIDYNTGPAFCDTGGTWEIYKEGSTSTALFAQQYLTCLNKSSIKPYAIVSCGGICTSDPDIGIRNGTDVLGCTDGSVYSPTYFISGTLKVTWKRAGKYKVKYKPGNPGCPLIERYVTVIDPVTTISVGALSGNQYPACNFGGYITYSVPAITGVTQYEWRLIPDATSPRQLDMLFSNGTTSITTVKSFTTAQAFTTAGYASGKLRVTARTPCGGISTREWVINRTSPPSGISGPSSICVGSSAYYNAPDGSSNQYWTTSSNFMLNGNTGGNVMLQAVSEGSGVIQVSYNRACDNLSSTDRMGVYANSCGYYATTDQVTLSVSPNPVSDAVEVTYTETRKAYPVKVYNAYNKVVASGTLRNGKLRLNMGHAPAGVYLVNLLDEARGVVSVRLAKN